MHSSQELIYDVMQIRSIGKLDTPLPVLNRLIMCSKNGLIKIFKDVNDKPICYIAYSKISSDTLRVMARTFSRPRFYYEYNQGHFIYIIDIVIPYEKSHSIFPQVIDYLKANKCIVFFKNKKCILYLRKDGKFKKFILGSRSTGTTNNMSENNAC